MTRRNERPGSPAPLGCWHLHWPYENLPGDWTELVDGGYSKDFAMWAAAEHVEAHWDAGDAPPEGVEVWLQGPDGRTYNAEINHEVEITISVTETA